MFHGVNPNPNGLRMFVIGAESIQELRNRQLRVDCTQLVASCTVQYVSCEDTSCSNTNNRYTCTGPRRCGYVSGRPFG